MSPAQNFRPTNEGKATLTDLIPATQACDDYSLSATSATGELTIDANWRIGRDPPLHEGLEYAKLQPSDL
jgi:hypothetical protein